MTRASALTNPEPMPEDLEALKKDFYSAPAEEQDGELTPSETSAQELVPAGVPKTPLHLAVRNLENREENREREVRLLDEAVSKLQDEMKERDEAWRVRFEGLADSYRALLARVQEVGDWVGAPDWKPSKDSS